LKIKFWGVRGSVPSPSPDTIQVGGNTSCVEIVTGQDELVILDAGTGLRLLGKQLVQQQQHRSRRIHLLLSHTHWDHIQGLPFFAPLNFSDNHLTVYGADKPTKTLKDVLRQQMSFEYFPVSLDELPARIDIQPLQEEHFQIGDLQIQTAAFNHPGGVYGFRIEQAGQTLVYATDMEYTPDNLERKLIDFARHADVLIYDAQYTPAELKIKAGWGHSTHLAAAHLAERAEVKRLLLFSHDPDHSDQTLEEMELEAQTIFPASFLAREGLSLDLAKPDEI